MQAQPVAPAGSLVQSSLGGEVVQVGERRLAFVYPGTLITLGMLLVVAIWALGAVTMGVGGALNADLGAVAGGVFGGVLTVGFAALARRRWRTMGRFDLDVEGGVLVYARGRTERGRWKLEDVRFELRWDPFHRGFELAYWLVARVPDGRGMRLAKGPRDEMQPLIERLKGWGLRTS